MVLVGCWGDMLACWENHLVGSSCIGVIDNDLIAKQIELENKTKIIDLELAHSSTQHSWMSQRGSSSTSIGDLVSPFAGICNTSSKRIPPTSGVVVGTSSCGVAGCDASNPLAGDSAHYAFAHHDSPPSVAPSVVACHLPCTTTAPHTFLKNHDSPHRASARRLPCTTMAPQTVRLFGWHILAYLDLSWLISSHRALFILPVEHYSFYQPNILCVSPSLCSRGHAGCVRIPSVAETPRPSTRLLSIATRRLPPASTGKGENEWDGIFTKKHLRLCALLWPYPLVSHEHTGSVRSEINEDVRGSRCKVNLRVPSLNKIHVYP
jgi:hypothetical protein